MRPKAKLLTFGLFLLLGYLAPGTAYTAAQSSGSIHFDSFTGIYHLSRDSLGLSLLTTEETIVADFPSSPRFYGIKRIIPEKYQNRSVNVKILNVVDAAGNSVPYKTASDKLGNLEVTTGDPAIMLFGSQTIKIRYQTTGVVNLSQKTDEFLLNVNGRGWEQSFNRVDAAVHVPKSFQASLRGQSSCYRVIDISRNDKCEINTAKSADTTVITARATSLAAHEGLVVKVDFQPSTFTNNQSFLNENRAILIGLAIICAASVSAYIYLAKRPRAG